MSQNEFIVTSNGPDALWQSAYDIRAEITVTSTHTNDLEKAASGTGGDLLSWAHPEETWIEWRMAELGRSGDDETEAETPPGVFGFDVRWDVGGATTMQGASYFWFFTWVMLGTAILFVPVGFFYRPQTYLQIEQEG